MSLTHVTPSGKMCTVCRNPKAPAYIELDMMCPVCYRCYVVEYHRVLFNEANEKLGMAEHVESLKKDEVSI
jgi:hypothetical protein